MLSEQLTKSSSAIYELYGVDLNPKWFPVFYVLEMGEEKTVTGIAKEIGHSHPSVSKIIREMVKKGIVLEKKGTIDARQKIVKLSQKGLALKGKISPQYQDTTKAIETMLAGTTHNLWKAVEEWEYLLKQQDLLSRIKSEKKKRVAKEISITPFTTEFKPAFKALNVEWISAYFVMEEKDYQSLDEPENNILAKGGHIFMAIYKGEPVGTCSLIKMRETYDFELAKMAVSPKAQGLGIGWLLGQKIIEKAKALGGKTLFLESNTKLQPALQLYHKLGFIKIPSQPSEFARSNIQMLLNL